MSTINRLFGFRTVRGHTFYSKSLSQASTVIDLGANLGHFSKQIASRYTCKVFAVEASPVLFAQIDEGPLLQKYNYAVASTDGFVTFYESSNIEAGNIVGIKANSTGSSFEVKSTNLTSLFTEIGTREIDLLKIDIEGAEIDLFDNVQAEDLASVKQLSIEFHDSVPLPNVSTNDVQRIIKKISSMGFDGIPMGKKNLDWLFLNRNTAALPVYSKLYLSLRKRLNRCSI